MICTHNPRPDYLDRVLAALDAQTLSKDAWELLLIDNASKDAVAGRHSLAWHPRARHVREETLGLTLARLRGIAESSGDLLVFVDDDNVLAPDFLERSSELLRSQSHLGVFGVGVLTPQFEVEPPAVLRPYLHRLALREVAKPQWSKNMADAASVPWGAGLCVTRPIAFSYQQFLGRMTAARVLDRLGENLYSSGDDLFPWLAVIAGKGFGIFPELRATHLISAGRLNRAYFLRLFRDHSFSEQILNYMLSGAEPQPPDVRRVARILLHGLRHGRFSMRLRWATALGAWRARRFISENKVQPFSFAGECPERQ